MKDYQKDKMFLVMFHNDQDQVPAAVANFVKDSFNDEIVARLDRYHRDMPGNVLALIFTGDTVFFHSQPFEGSPQSFQELLAKPFGLKPSAEADFAAFDRFLVQTDAFIRGEGDSMVDLAIGWLHFATFVTDNCAASRNLWTPSAGPLG